MAGPSDGGCLPVRAVIGPHETVAVRFAVAAIRDRDGRGGRCDPDRDGIETLGHYRDERGERVTNGCFDTEEVDLPTGTIAGHLERRRGAGEHAAVTIAYRRDAHHARRRVDPDPIPIVTMRDRPVLLARPECRAHFPWVQ